MWKKGRRTSVSIIPTTDLQRENEWEKLSEHTRTLLCRLFDAVEVDDESIIQTQRIVYSACDMAEIDSNANLATWLGGVRFGTRCFIWGKKLWVQGLLALSWVFGSLAVVVGIFSLPGPRTRVTNYFALLALPGPLFFSLTINRKKLSLVLKQFEFKFLLLNTLIQVSALMYLLGDASRMLGIAVSAPSWVIPAFTDTFSTTRRSSFLLYLLRFLVPLGSFFFAITALGVFFGIVPVEESRETVFGRTNTKDILYTATINAVVFNLTTAASKKGHFSVIKSKVQSAVISKPLAHALTSFTPEFLSKEAVREAEGARLRRNSSFQRYSRLVAPVLRPFLINARDTLANKIAGHTFSNVLYRLIASPLTGFGIFGVSFAAGMFLFTDALGRETLPTYILLVTLTMPASVVDFLLVNPTLLFWVTRRFKNWYLMFNYAFFAIFGAIQLKEPMAQLSLGLLSLFCCMGTVLNDIVPESLRKGLALIFLPMQVAFLFFILFGLTIQLLPLFHDTEYFYLYGPYKFSVVARIIPCSLNILTFCLNQYAQKISHPEQFSSIVSDTTILYVKSTDLQAMELFYNPPKLQIVFQGYFESVRKKKSVHHNES